MEHKETSDHNESQNTESKQTPAPTKPVTETESKKLSEPKDDTKAPQQRRQPVKVIRDARKSKPENQPQDSDVYSNNTETAAPPSESSSQDSKQSEGDDNRQRPRRGRRGRKGNDAPHSPQNPQRQIKVDHEDVSKKAWKIFLAEVAEDGLGLITDKDAKEMAKRSFRVAELFLEEDARRRPEERTSRISTAPVKKDDKPQASTEDSDTQAEVKPIKKKASKKSTKRARSNSKAPEKIASDSETPNQEKEQPAQEPSETAKAPAETPAEAPKDTAPTLDAVTETKASPTPDTESKETA